MTSPVPQVLPHRDAVVALLEGAGLTVHVGVAPPGAVPPYVALYLDAGVPERSSLVPVPDIAAVTVQVTCVGASEDQALWVLDVAGHALLSARLPVEGRAGWCVEPWAAGPPCQRDDDVTPPLYYMTPQYRLRSSPS